MSWHTKTCGTKSEVTAAIDEAMAASGGMPRAVGEYLKDAVAQADLVDGGVERYYVLVESSGHRPMTGSGSAEKCLVTTVRRGPWNLPRSG